MTDLGLDKNERYFTPADVWRGGSYELKIALGTATDERLVAALCAIWSHPSLYGCFTNGNSEPWDQILVRLEDAEDPFSLFGIIRISDRLLPCTTYVVREKDESGNLISDFVGLWVPMGALGKVFTVGTFPFGDADKASAWRPVIDSVLVSLGKSVFDSVPFNVALIGWEVQLTCETLTASIESGRKENRYEGVLLNEDGIVRWYAPNRHDLIHIQGR
jgi:hypothetical protein